MFYEKDEIYEAPGFDANDYNQELVDEAYDDITEQAYELQRMESEFKIRDLDGEYLWSEFHSNLKRRLNPIEKSDCIEMLDKYVAQYR